VLASWPPLAEAELMSAEDPANADKVLSVLRFSPEGELPLVPQLSITFSQPMVPVSGQADLAASVPVRLEPQPPGRWRWIGSRTLVFDPEGGRLPMATEYRLHLPAGLTSAVGGVLLQSQTFDFATPAARMQPRSSQTGPLDLQPVLVLQFDQLVDFAEVLAKTRLIGPEGSAVELQMLEPESPEVVRALKEHEVEPVEGRWLAVQPKRRLKTGSLYRAEVASGLGSLEGPRKTTAAQSWAFSTYSPLEFRYFLCGSNASGKDCDPGEVLRLKFNNSLDAADFDPSSLRVEPAVEELSLHVYGEHLNLRGVLSPRTEYRVSLPARLKDRFGQTLGRAQDIVVSTGDAAPRLHALGGPLVTLDPASAPSFSVYTRGIETLDVEIYRVRPEQWPEFLRWRANQQNERDGDVPPGELVSKRQLRPVASGGISETLIELQEHLSDGLGHLVLNLSSNAAAGTRAWHGHRVWLQATRLGLVAVRDRRQMSAWVSELATGRALPGVDVSVRGTASRARTGVDGMATLDLPSQSDVPLLIAQFGEDSALLPDSLYHAERPSWAGDAQTERLRWMVFDDRGMYRPGEQVRVKGWLRQLPSDPSGDLQLPTVIDARVRWTLADSLGVEIGQGEAEMSGLGGFDFAIDLPSTPNLGPAVLALQRVEASDVDSKMVHTHEFWIEEFRRPEYEVRTKADAGPHLLGSRARIEVDANYYSGGALASTPVRWTLFAQPTRYVPPGRSDFNFGGFSPWWSRSDEPGEDAEGSFEGRTDDSGRHAIEVEFLGADRSRPHLLLAEASVSDLNRQVLSANSVLLVHPAQHYVGLKAKRSFVQRSETLEVESVVVDIEGALVAASLPQIRLTRLVWKEQDGTWIEVAEPAGTCAPEALESGHRRCRWTPQRGGTYLVEASVRDGQGRTSSSELRVWVAGGEAAAARGVEVQDLLLVPDREDPRPGEILQVFVQAPFDKAEGLMTLDRGGMLQQRRFSLEQGSATLEVPILESMAPGFDLRLAVVGQAPRTDLKGEAGLLNRRPKSIRPRT
jgi:uncharacterized protein YfaS (alpha-2-macroglobulin family)